MGRKNKEHAEGGYCHYTIKNGGTTQNKQNKTYYTKIKIPKKKGEKCSLLPPKMIGDSTNSSSSHDINITCKDISNLNSQSTNSCTLPEGCVITGDGDLCPTIKKTPIKPISVKKNIGSQGMPCCDCNIAFGALAAAIQVYMVDEEVEIEAAVEAGEKSVVSSILDDGIKSALEKLQFKTGVASDIAAGITFMLMGGTSFKSFITGQGISLILGVICKDGFNCDNCTCFDGGCSNHTQCCSQECNQLNGVATWLACPFGYKDYGTKACCKTMWGTIDKGNCPVWSCGV